MLPWIPTDEEWRNEKPSSTCDGRDDPVIADRWRRPTRLARGDRTVAMTRMNTSLLARSGRRRMSVMSRHPPDGLDDNDVCSDK
jgi:hypothetical protein